MDNRQEEKEVEDPMGGIREGVRAFWVCWVVCGACLATVLRLIRWKLFNKAFSFQLIAVSYLERFAC